MQHIIRIIAIWSVHSVVSFVFVPANRMWALDPKFQIAEKSQTVPYWTVLLFRFILSLVYVNAGISKLSEDSIWEIPLFYFLEALQRYLNIVFKQPLFAMFLSWIDLLSNLISPFHYRQIACFSTYYTFGFFSIRHHKLDFLWARLEPLQVINRCQKKKSYTPPPPTIPRKASKSLSKHERRTIFILLAFCLVQITFPLPHYMYPGNVLWTEIGVSFSWREVATSEIGFVQIHTKNPNYQGLVIRNARMWWKRLSLCLTCTLS